MSNLSQGTDTPPQRVSYPDTLRRHKKIIKRENQRCKITPRRRIKAVSMSGAGTGIPSHEVQPEGPDAAPTLDGGTGLARPGSGRRLPSANSARGPPCVPPSPARPRLAPMVLQSQPVSQSCSLPPAGRPPSKVFPFLTRFTRVGAVL